MDIRKLALALLFVASMPAAMDAQYLKRSWDNEVSFGGGWCTNENFNVEFSYFRFPARWFAVGAYVGFEASSKNRPVPYGPVPAGSRYSGIYNQWILMEEHQKVTGVTLTPSVMFSTPDLEIGAVRINLRAIPGITLSIPAERVEAEFRMVDPAVPVEYSNFKYEKFWLHGSQWWAWSGRVALQVSIDELCFGLGYGISNHDIWATRRTGAIEGTSFAPFYPESQPCYHNFFVYTAWKF